MNPGDELNWLDGMIRCWRGEIAWRRQHNHNNVPYDLARIVCQLEVRKEQIENKTNIIKLPFGGGSLPTLWQTL